MRALTSTHFYPLHIEAGNFYFHQWKGERQVGRYLKCLVCGITNNTRNRNGDARFIRTHKRCGFDRGTA